MSDTVVVGCKLPSGFLLRVFEFVDSTEATPAGSKKAKVARQLPQVFEAKGSATQPNKAPAHIVTESGAGLTQGCPRELWELWLAQNKDTDLVKNGLIFAYDDLASARDLASEREGQKTGMEPMSQTGDPRAPKSIKKGDRKDDV
jgi:hypothetical protein